MIRIDKARKSEAHRKAMRGSLWWQGRRWADNCVVHRKVRRKIRVRPRYLFFMSLQPIRVASSPTQTASEAIWIEVFLLLWQPW
jgi:hypothetical protein